MQVTLSLQDGTIKQATLMSGGLSSLIALPPTQEPDTNDWGEENGKEVDTILPLHIVADDVSIPLWSTENIFSSILSSTSVSLSVSGKVFTLRPKKVEDMERTPKGWFAKLVCSRMPEQVKPKEGPEPIDFASFGCVILQEAIKEPIYTAPVLKEAPFVDDIEGRVYFDAGITPRASFELEIPMLMVASSMADLWARRTSLLERLIAKGLRSIPPIAGGFSSYKGYYSTCTSKDDPIESNGSLKWVFSLTFVITEI